MTETTQMKALIKNNDNNMNNKSVNRMNNGKKMQISNVIDAIDIFAIKMQSLQRSRK